ncbi:glutathione S-transferase family protein [Isoalcanivorax beigongshangi]|uniref:Glutathione S-transferase family protein n=1 Tax=Isoalcanivorax beigongshangi TaxID=3238810 RepID=A0ABV4ACZ0_9GAMM
MGVLVHGHWQDQWYDTDSTGGHFERSAAQFRNWVTPDGAPGPSGRGGFAAEPNRYHLYVSYACPWAHRTLILRQLKGLAPIIGVSVVHPLMAEHGWTFATDFDGANGDAVNGHQRLYQLYQQALPDYSGRVTVPVLWDTRTDTVVSNESAEILRMFNSAFDGVGARAGDYYPAALRSEIDRLNDWIYPRINNGVYRAGFATRQQPYDEAVNELFAALEQLEQRLAQQRYLVGDRITEADWRLFTTLVRFDGVYVGHFKCDRKRLIDYPNLFAYTRELYQMPGVAETVHMDHIRFHYYRSHPSINPHGIIPVGPQPNFSRPHQRNAIHAGGLS